MAQTGGMLALVPSAADLARLAVAGGEDPGELHLTLAYLGDDVTGWSPENRAALIDEVRERIRGGPIVARVMGHAVFNPDGHDGREPCQVYLVADSDRLAPLRADLVALLGHKVGVPAQHEPFLPHVTGAYGADAVLSYTGPVTFDRVRVALAEEVTDMSLPLFDDDEDADDDEATEGPDAADEDEDEDEDEDGGGGNRISIEVNIGADDEDDDEDEEGRPSGVQVKNKVATNAGAAYYGVPIGTELGQARNQQAQQAQDTPGARDAYADLIKTNPRDYRGKLDNLSDGDLQKLSRVAYSARSSNPMVVQARLAIAAALRRRGQDVNDFGGLGKSSTGTGPTRPPVASRRGRASTAATTRSTHSTGRRGTGTGTGQAKDPSWVGNEDWQTRRTRRVKLGLMGTRGSQPPSAPTKRGEGGQVMRLHVYEDGSWQYKSAPDDVEVSPLGYVEVKGGPPPWVKKKDDGKGGGSDDDKGGTEGSTIKTVGDLATAIKKAKSIKDPEKRDAARARCRAAAAKIGGPAKHMIPKDWGSGGKGEGGKGNLAPPFQKGGTKSLFDEDDIEVTVEQAMAIELKAMSPDPKAAKLREYWAHGKGRSKWRPGSAGDFDRLRRHLRKYVPPEMLNGLTANIHKLATGEWPGKGAHGGKLKRLPAAKALIGSDGVEVKTVALDAGDVADAQAVDPMAGATDDDAVSLALDHYAQMVDELTPEEEYEQALAEEIDWELLADGTLERADGQDEDTPDARDVDVDDERAPDDPERMLDLLEAAFA